MTSSQNLTHSLHNFLFQNHQETLSRAYSLIHDALRPKNLVLLEGKEQRREENLRQFREIVSLGLDGWYTDEHLDGNPTADTSSKHNLTTTQQRTREDLIAALWRRVHTVNAMWDAGMVGQVTSTLHQLFSTTIESLGTKESHARFFPSSPDMKNLSIFGCFALTEMTHGSDTKNMKTEVRYLPETQSFELHTPHRDASKVWIGNLGKHATHAIVAAQLIIQSKSYGLHWFVVPIRNEVTHDMLPGVYVGDWGSKTSATWDAMDNGFVWFDHVKLPLASMLNRYQEVTPQGEYVVKIKDRRTLFGLTLGALSGGRVGIAHDVVSRSRLSLIIAVRYSHARKQFGEPTRNSPETEQPVISYQYQQYRLMPRLATYFCMNFFGRNLHNWYQELKQMTASGDITHQFLDMNSEIHALSCGFKPVASWHARDTMQICRECAGGHGFAAWARLTALRDDLDPSLTYEGDNNVIIAQVAKYLLQAIKRVHQGRKVSSPFHSIDYLNDLAKFFGQKCNIESSFKSTEEISNALKWKSMYLLVKSSKKLANLMGSSEKTKSTWSAFNQTQAFHLHSAARAHMDNVVFQCAMEHIQNCTDTQVRNVLTQCAHLFGLWSLVAKDESSSVLLEGGYMNAHQMQLARDEILEWCRELSEVSLSLVNAVAPPDFILNSAIAPSDLDYPKAIWNRVLQEKGVYEKAKYWEILRTPVQKRGGLASKL
uniref:Acyl-coenzyme A oxidase n=1 Tax=Percolomonas cosmopolitus TaxID=63605 RepID=A0A7S1KN30_9EUKA|mmetsp:Transcript_240/g.787  ORF Transcript_240/g.787 Transcript_240/m.787 type:complete len:712 (+) Transcript_240:99-2234(+)|eukprot:CAMPEP_0117441338 /NCGR_PEP_ID=MMETSP0759-20121206/3583_1 /TAXON_ID=63605 /ORGANISM="Percolomonas cosmopolitus, Strain WS" /LENGTH=711 /DNA_ID=CAMNT_0005233189 /DNA_START=24 /DNA_END=2159 /DNA_ORIENTATION=-